LEHVDWSSKNQLARVKKITSLYLAWLASSHSQK
jgi:hypothetical protein